MKSRYSFLIILTLTILTIRNPVSIADKQIQNETLWQVGDNYSYITIGEFGNDTPPSVYTGINEIISVSTYNNEQVFIINSTPSGTTEIVGPNNYTLTYQDFWFYRRMDTFDVIGVSSKENYTSYYSDIPSYLKETNFNAKTYFSFANYSIGTVSWQEIGEHDSFYTYDQSVTGLNQSKNEINLRVNYTADISSMEVSTLAGTFYCWKADIFQEENDIKIKYFYVNGSVYSTNISTIYSDYNSTHITENSTIISTSMYHSGSFLQPRVNTTRYLSKKFGITVKTENWKVNDGSWYLHSGTELSSFNNSYYDESSSSSTSEISSSTTSEISSSSTSEETEITISITTANLPFFIYLLMVGIILRKKGRK